MRDDEAILFMIILAVPTIIIKGMIIPLEEESSNNSDGITRKMCVHDDLSFGTSCSLWIRIGIKFTAKSYFQFVSWTN